MKIKSADVLEKKNFVFWKWYFKRSYLSQFWIDQLDLFCKVLEKLGFQLVWYGTEFSSSWWLDHWNLVYKNIFQCKYKYVFCISLSILYSYIYYLFIFLKWNHRKPFWNVFSNVVTSSDLVN